MLDNAKRQDNAMPEQPVSAISRSLASLSVFFPAFNDAPSLRVLIPKTVEVIRGLAQDYEILVVDDGSRDDTPRVLEEMRQRFPCLRLVRHPRNLGYGAALRSGFRNATKQLVFYTDGDGQYDVAELQDLYDRLDADVGVVNGYKIERADGLYRTLIGRLYRGVVKVLFGLKVRDIDCDFRLMRRHILEGLTFTCSSGAVCVELMTQIERAGIRIVDVPVHHYPRLSGRSQFFRVGPVARTVLDIVRLWGRRVVFGRGREARPVALGPRFP